MKTRSTTFGSAAALAALLSLAACAETAPSWIGTPDSRAGTIEWSDGDSGRIDGAKFRLASVDAPETSPVGSRYGAECESERILGLEAKTFVEDLTDSGNVRVSRQYGEDRYGRAVVELEVDGQDVAATGLDAGYLQSWPHDQASGRALAPKPRWCRYR